MADEADVEPETALVTWAVPVVWPVELVRADSTTDDDEAVRWLKVMRGVVDVEATDDEVDKEILGGAT